MSTKSATMSALTDMQAALHATTKYKKLISR